MILNYTCLFQFKFSQNKRLHFIRVNLQQLFLIKKKKKTITTQISEVNETSSCKNKTHGGIPTNPEAASRWWVESTRHDTWRHAQSSVRLEAAGGKRSGKGEMQGLLTQPSTDTPRRVNGSRLSRVATTDTGCSHSLQVNEFRFRTLFTKTTRFKINVYSKAPKV